MSNPPRTQPHSGAWVAQVWISFAVSVGATALGILYLPVDIWMKAFVGMGLLFSVGSTLNVAKTTRDQFEAEKLHAKVDEARLERLLVEHDPMK
ncbi:MAG: YiaA/YiaB family inner membrane protein [Myxococcota bacterium]